MGKKERDSSLDAVKGFTILIVMLGHVLVLNKINDPILYDWIKAVQMPLFMMVSGYLCGLSSKAQSPGITDVWSESVRWAICCPFLPGRWCFIWMILPGLSRLIWSSRSGDCGFC